MSINADLPVIAFSSICEEDAIWIDQYLAEVERLGIKFAINFDRCSRELKNRMVFHPNFAYCFNHDDHSKEYTEQDKQKVFDYVQYRGGKKWALHWDMDEIWAKDTPDKLMALASRSEDYLRTSWINLWGDKEHIRNDGPGGLCSSARRVKLYNVSNGRRWKFDHPITYGCKLMDAEGNCPHGNGVLGETDIDCLHTGLMTRELREQHSARWDRIYGKAVGENPYGFWKQLLDEGNNPPTIYPNTYL